MPKIQYTTTDGASGEFELGQERVTVGRAEDNQLVIPDGSVSSHHAEINFDGSSWVLTDTGSTNGTKVGGARVETVNLGATSNFSLGQVECVFIGDGQSAESAPAEEASWQEASAPAARSSTLSSGGYGSMPYDRAARTGFGPHRKEKDSSGAMAMLLGVLGLLACGAAVFMAMSMGA